MSRSVFPRRLVTAALAVSLITVTFAPANTAVANTAVAGSGPAARAVLTNLAHLDALTTQVRLPARAGHTTYQLKKEPSVTELWVYANHEDDGTYQPTGGGTYDPATNTYGQGAYDADDVARAAVVYLRHWRQFHDAASRTTAFGLLRGLTYLQTATGPDAGNVVLWMQPDGALNPSPTPVELPDPSDSGASYWLARTIWALGEGYAAFQHVDPSFARFLRTRLDLAVGAVRREVLVHYGQHYVINGVRTPAWLIVDGADASAEAVLGLSAYVDASNRSAPDPAARTALAQLAHGIAEMGAGGIRQWPYGALLPSARSVSEWHAWAAQMPSALAVAATSLHDPSLLRPAIRDTAQFTPALLASTGPVNGLSPAPVDGSQIAYGADARVQALVRVGRAARAPGITRLAGIAAGWYFGQNPSGRPMYDPATGVTYDGVSAEGVVNLNSGAESTIHGLLSMLVLDADPALAALARTSAHVVARDGQQVVEAESATLAGPAEVVTADPLNTGVAQWSAGAYVNVNGGSTLTWSLPAEASAGAQPRLVEPIVDRVPGSAGHTAFSAAGRPLGTVAYGGAGAQGQSVWSSTLVPVTLGRAASAAPSTLTARTYGGAGRLDALLITPLVSTLSLRGGRHYVVLLTSRSAHDGVQTIALAGSGPSEVDSYDRSGQLATASGQHGATVHADVPGGGFVIITQ